MKAALFLTFYLLTFSLLGQSEYTFTEILTSLYSEKLNTASLENLSFRAPYIEDIEFRTETDRYLLDRQEYSLRFTPMNPRVRKLQRLIYQDIIEIESLRMENPNMILIEDYYEQYLDQYFAAKELELGKQKISIQNDVILTAKKDLAADPIDPVRLVEALREMEEFEFDNLRLMDELFAYGNPLVDSSSEIIEIAKIQFLIEESIIKESKMELRTELELRKLERERQLELADKNRIFDFAQLNYSGPHDQEFNRRTSVTMAFRLPFAGEGKFDLAEQELESIFEKQQLTMSQRELEMNATLAKIEVLKSIKDYEAYKAFEQRINAHSSGLQNFTPETKGDILRILDLKLEEIDTKIALLQREKDVYQAYFEWLKESNSLSIMPAKNYLDPLLPILVTK